MLPYYVVDLRQRELSPTTRRAMRMVMVDNRLVNTVYMRRTPRTSRPGFTSWDR